MPELFLLGVKHLKLTVDILASIIYTIIVPREQVIHTKSLPSGTVVRVRVDSITKLLPSRLVLECGGKTST